MLLKREVLEAIHGGEVDVAFRRWKRPTVKSGGTLRTRVGVLRIVSVERVGIDQITDADARRAGHSDLAALLGDLQSRREWDVYRIEFGGLQPDPRMELCKRTEFTEVELDDLRLRLQRLDAHSKDGAWTREYLEVLDRNPHVRAQELADRLAVDKAKFKRRVRRLKELGLTISHSPGYELSPRGKALLERW